MKILGSVWFTNSLSGIRPIGIVLVDNGYEDKAYIGLGYGDTEAIDEKLIANLGSTFPVDLARILILGQNDIQKR